MDTVEPTVAVIVLTMNQRDITLKCLSSLALQKGRFHVLLWDNGSQDDTGAAVNRSFPEVYVHYHPRNLGVASGRNAAAQLAISRWHPTYLLFLDNDMLLEPNFVLGLLEPFRGDPTVGQTQAKLRFMHDQERLNDGGGAQINFVRWQITPVGYGEVDRGQYDTIKRCISCGGAMMVRTDLFQQLGGFDTTFDPFGPEDLDFSLRLQKAGYVALYAPQATAYHVVSHTFGKGYSENYARHKSRHWFLFMRRHASPLQQMGFLVWGAPTMALRVLWREGRKGNLGAFRGLVRGITDTIKSTLHAKGKSRIV